MKTMTAADMFFLDKAILRFVFAIIISILLHIPFIFLVNNPENNNIIDPDADFSFVVAMPSLDAENISKFEKDLYAWAELADPGLLLKPNLAEGFSAFASPNVDFAEPALPTRELEEFNLPENVFAISQLTVPNKSFNEVIQEQWNKDTSYFLPELQRNELAKGVFWRIAGGREITNEIKLPEEEFQKLLENNAEVAKIKSPTQLEVSSLKNLNFPRIIVRESCGNSKFDNLAIQALKNYFNDFLQNSQNKNQSINFLKGAVFLEIDWRLPAFEEKI